MDCRGDQGKARERARRPGDPRTAGGSVPPVEGAILGHLVVMGSVWGWTKPCMVFVYFTFWVGLGGQENSR